jgi:hypothetical protein
MNYEQDVFTHQYSIVDCFIYHLPYCRTLNKGYTERRLHNRFWHMTIEAHLFAARMNRCMVFGSHGCNAGCDFFQVNRGLLSAANVHFAWRGVTSRGCLRGVISSIHDVLGLRGESYVLDCL